ncbi:alkaline ceramidase-like [Homarus americanus]|uniref:Alkaline ceramidase n=1 Tax=Homarus americanus TaxID=6706 RepID=A0A8J5NCA2_HOMAM|nr:alkaline ceramidase-like [Homarus americanus]KAG7176593.1 Alkaline ceramidase-like [Homarus americanus]
MTTAGGLVVSWVGPGTSPVDWCEGNYTVTPHIAEFVNTITNIVFLVGPAACTKLWASYARHVSRGIHVVWVFFVVIGLSSAYFHATLSLLGQLLDELSILWVLMVSYTLFTPLRYRPKFLRSNQQLYAAFMTFLAVFITASAFVQPAINAYALFVVGLPAVTMLVLEIRKSRDPNVVRLGTITLASLVLAATAWVCDRFLCAMWLALDMTVLHGLWHILIFITAYSMQVLFCYFHATQDVPESRPVLRYWPRRSWGLPYVYCLLAQHDKTP